MLFSEMRAEGIPEIKRVSAPVRYTQPNGIFQESPSKAEDLLNQSQSKRRTKDFSELWQR